MKPDAKGWYWHERAWLRLTGLAWRGVDAAFAATYAVVQRTPWRARGPWVHESGVYMWLVAESYLYEDLKRGDLPENLRVGGVWR